LRSKWIFCLTVSFAVICGRLVRAEEQSKPEDSQKQAPAASAPRTPRQAIDSGMSFLVNDVAKWRKERTCVTCHHGIMTVWALSEAKSQGYNGC
jgi:hypothetical protein